jgi:hypothetical protein
VQHLAGFAVRDIGDGTGIDYINVRTFIEWNDLIALAAELLRHGFRLIRIHTAAKGMKSDFFPHVLFLPGITIQQKNAPESGNGLDCLRNSGYDERVLTRKSSHQAMPHRQALRAVRLIIIFNDYRRIY